MVKFLYWSRSKPRTRLMGLPFPWLQSSSPRCCFSWSHSQLTDVSVQLKRYNQFHPTRASNWLSVMSVVTQTALIYTACRQSFTDRQWRTFIPISIYPWRLVKMVEKTQTQFCHHCVSACCYKIGKNKSLILNGNANFDLKALRPLWMDL